ncbi:NHL repeat-containing protein, partial [Pseudomonadota bacterium]
MVKVRVGRNQQVVVRLWAALALLLAMLVVAPGSRAATMPSFQSLPPVLAGLKAPEVVALGSAEEIYVAEPSEDRVLAFSPNGQYLSTIAGFSEPISIAVGPGGDIFVGNAGRGNVEIYSSEFALIGELGVGAGEFVRPTGVAVDAAGKIYVTDGGADLVKVYNPDYSFDFSFGGTGTTDGLFNTPIAITINDATSEVVVSDLAIVQKYNSGWKDTVRIQVFNLLDGVFKRLFYTYGPGDSHVRPLGLAVDGTAADSNRIYVSDAYQNMVLVYDNIGTYLGYIH